MSEPEENNIVMPDFGGNPALSELEGNPAPKVPEAQPESEAEENRFPVFPEGSEDPFGGLNLGSNDALDELDGKPSKAAEDESDDDDGDEEVTDEYLTAETTKTKDLTKDQQKRRKKLLRDQIKDLQSQLKLEREKAGKLDTVESEWSEKEKTLRQELEVLRQETLKSATPAYSPDSDPEIQSILQKQAALTRRLAIRAPGIRDKIVDLAGKFWQAQNKGDEDLAAFESEMEDQFGSKSTAIVDGLAEFVDLHLQAREIAHKGQENWAQTLSEQYTKRREEHQSSLGFLGNASEGEITEAPYSLNSIITKAVKQVPGLAGEIDKVKSYATQMLTGVEPVAPGSKWAEYVQPDGSLSPQGQQAYLQEAQQLAKMQKAVVAQWAQFRVASMLLPSAMKRAAELEGRLGERSEEEPKVTRERNPDSGPMSKTVNVEVEDPSTLPNPYLAQL